MLKQDPTQPARWSTESPLTGPSTFAVVIGVSRYDHLDGSEENSYGLGQLAVSALTAQRFFSWLQDEYQHPDKPLAECWLLLAPSDDEKAADPTLSITPRPTFENCRRAIGYWFKSMSTLNPAYAQSSRAMFFFSGHGLEVSADRQILLTSDYLEPPNRTVNTALSTFNIYTGLHALPLAEIFFFIDACRNDYPALRELGVEGTNVLNPVPSYKMRPDVKAPIVYATGPGAAAWQPSVASRDERSVSVFGRALVEGLKGTQGMVPLSDGERSWVTLRGLEDFLDPRVEALLLAAGTTVKQPVRIWGPVGKLAVCEVAPPPVDGSIAAWRFEPPSRSLMPMTPMTFQRLHLPALLPEVGASSAQDIHSVVKDEFLANLLTSSRTYDFDTRSWGALGSGPLTVREVSRDSNRRTYRIDLEVRSKAAVWFELDDPMADVRVACVLPSDDVSQPIYTLELDLRVGPGRGHITNFDVVLSTANRELLGETAQAWRKYRAVDLRDAASPSEVRILERALAYAVPSPLAATTVALLLLRAWRQDLLHDWARQLAQEFPASPDGGVIWAEQLLRGPSADTPSEVIPWLLTLRQRGLPHTAEGLGIAARQIDELLTFAIKPGDVPDYHRYDQLAELRVSLKRALSTCRPGGLTATFIGRKALVVPEMLAAVARPADSDFR
jgi:Caspase domain